MDRGCATCAVPGPVVALDVDLGHLIVDDHDAFHIAVLHHLLVLHGFDLHRSATHGEEVDRQDHHDDDPADPVEIEGALGLVAVVARSFGLIVRLLHGSGPLRFVQATLSYTCRARRPTGPPVHRRSACPQKDVHHHVHVVQQHPFRVVRTFTVPRFFTGLLLANFSTDPAMASTWVTESP